MPEYLFEEASDSDGCRVWKCTCRLRDDSKLCYNISESRKEAKKQAAFRMLEHVLDNYCV